MEKLLYTTKFNNILLIINNKVSKILLDLRNKELDIQFNNIIPIDNSNKVKITIKNRVQISIKIGRLVNKILKAKGGELIENSDLEDFVNKYTALSMFDDKFKDFELVSGKDIKKYYHYKKYSKDVGVLGNSCMKYDENQKFFKLYTKNKDKISLLILKDSNGKIKGRSIIWKNINMRPGEKGEVKAFKVNLMDRIYSYDDSVTEMFKHYAILKGWVIKKYQNSNNNGPFVLNNETLPNETKFFFYLNNVKNIKKFPYLDTMIKFSLEKGFISNRNFKKSVELLSTSGFYC